MRLSRDIYIEAKLGGKTSQKTRNLANMLKMTAKRPQKTLTFVHYFFKKVLTKRKACDIIVKLPPRELGDSETVIEN